MNSTSDKNYSFFLLFQKVCNSYHLYTISSWRFSQSFSFENIFELLVIRNVEKKVVKHRESVRRTMGKISDIIFILKIETKPQSIVRFLSYLDIRLTISYFFTTPVPFIIIALGTN